MVEKAAQEMRQMMSRVMLTDADGNGLSSESGVVRSMKRVVRRIGLSGDSPLRTLSLSLVTLCSASFSDLASYECLLESPLLPIVAFR